MLLEQITIELNSALKDGNTRKAGALRLLISELKNEEIKCRGEGKLFTPESEITVLQREAKKRKESYEVYLNAGRTDLSDQEKFEIELIESYLPEQMSKGEISIILNEIISQKGPDAPFGELMKEAMVQLKGKAEGKLISETLNELIKTT